MKRYFLLTLACTILASGCHPAIQVPLDDTGQFDEPWSQYTGATGTFRARIWIFPASNLAFVAAANGDSPDVHRVASMVFQRVKAAAVQMQP